MNKTFLGVLLMLTMALVVHAVEPAIIPQPQHLQLRDGTFLLDDKTVIVFAGENAGEDEQQARAEAEFLANQLRRATGLPLPVVSKSAKDQKGILFFLAPHNTSIQNDEGYGLNVYRGLIQIHARTAAGLFYGGQTLLQLLPPQIFATNKVSGVAWEIPCVDVNDAPRFPWRGLLVDVSRHFLTVDELKTFIDLMAMHKFNTLHFHLTDDQGWRLEIKKYPLLTKLGSVRSESPMPGDRNQGDGKPYGPFFYTQDQIRDLVAYAKVRHVTIMPEIEMPGHLLGVLTAYPQYSCTGGPFHVRTRWGVEKDVLCIGNTNSLGFMEDILTEVLALFPSKFIHIGGDEVPRDRWNECPKCQALMKTEGMTNAAQLQTWFNARIETFLASKGRRMIGWDEILEGGLTPGAAVMSWRGVEGGTAAADAGHDAVMSPGAYLYLDHSQAKGPNEPETIGGYTPLNKTYSYEPVPPQLSPAQARHILGAQGNLWSEYFYEPTFQKVEYQAFPRACALAEVDWSPKSARNFLDFYQRLQVHVKRLDELNVNYRHLDAATVDLSETNSQ